MQACCGQPAVFYCKPTWQIGKTWPNPRVWRHFNGHGPCLIAETQDTPFSNHYIESYIIFDNLYDQIHVEWYLHLPTCDRFSSHGSGLQDLLRQLSNMVGTWLFSFLGVPGVYWQNRADHANFFLLFKFCFLFDWNHDARIASWCFGHVLSTAEYLDNFCCKATLRFPYYINRWCGDVSGYPISLCSFKGCVPISDRISEMDCRFKLHASKKAVAVSFE